MTIRIKKVDEDLYTATLKLPDMPAVKDGWSTTEPMRGRQLVRELVKRGCYQIDIGDAMNEQDPGWIEKLPDPYIPPE